MDRTNRTVQESIRLDSPTHRAEALTAPGVVTRIDPGVAYSRFSLALVRHPPETPYTSDHTVESPATVVPFLHEFLQGELSECLAALFLTVQDHTRSDMRSR